MTLRIAPCGFLNCVHPGVMRYPGNDPENGPARRYCKDGHSTCYRCGAPFQAIVRYEARTERYDEDDPSSEVVIPAGWTESDWCPECEESVPDDTEWAHDV